MKLWVKENVHVNRSMASFLVASLLVVVLMVLAPCFALAASPGTAQDTTGGASQAASSVQPHTLASPSIPSRGASGLSVSKSPQQTTAYPTPLQPGTYIILRNDTMAQALDVAGGSKRNGATVRLWQGNNTGAQLWRVSYDEQGRYTFVNAGSGKALDVSAGKARNAANVQQYAKNNTLAQKWIVVETENGFRIESAINRAFVLDCAGGGKKSGTNIQLYRNNNTPAQRFFFVNTKPKVSSERVLENGIYTIETRTTSKQLLDVSGGSAAKGANVQTYASNATTAQRWNVVWGSDGYYTLTSVESGMVLDVSSASKLPGANVQQWVSNNTDAQKWAIRANADGSYSLVNKCSGMALAVATSSARNGTNVYVVRPGAAKAQKFSFERVPVLADGTYVLYTKAAQTSMVVDITSASLAQGVQAQVWNTNSSAAQRFIFTHTGNDTYTIQAVVSGKYLADAGGRVVQQTLVGDEASENQLWRAAMRGNGLVLTNVATGKVATLSASTAKRGAKYVTDTYAGKAVSKFRPLRQGGLLGQALYTFSSGLGGSFVLDVAGGSWNNNANAQIYKSNNTNAQKFALVPAAGGYYHILMVLSGNALTAASENPTANVGLSTSVNNNALQLWKVALTGNGLVITNKASGSVLEVQDSKKANGVNVRVAPATGAANQSWVLGGTTVNKTDTASMRRIIKNAPNGGRPRLDANGRSYQISKEAYDQLINALSKAWNKGKYVDFFMLDVDTGVTLTCNANRNTYGASTSKAALVTYIYQEQIERGRVSYGSVEGLMWNTIVHSNNDTYAQLYGRFAGSGYRNWLNKTGVGWVANSQYTTTNPRSLELMWARILAYEQSNGRYVGKWRNMFKRSYYSFIRETLSGSNTVYSKPGWMFGGSFGTIHDDAAIVRDSSGRTYLLAVMTNLYPDGDRWIAKGVVRALDRIHREMPAA